MRLRDGAWIYHAKRNRQTGTEVVALYSPYADPDNPWETICVTHGTVCSHETRKLALRFVPVPAEWCEQCMDAMDAKT